MSNETSSAPIDGESEGAVMDVAQSRELHSRLETIFRYLPNVVLYETGGNREFVSDNISALIGHTAEEIAADRTLFPSLIHPDDRPRLNQSVAQWHEAGESGALTLQFRVQHANGEWIWIEDRMVEVKAPGRPKYMTGVLINISEQKQAERALADSENTLRALIDNLPFEVWAMDSNGRYFLANRFGREHRCDPIGLTIDDIPGTAETKQNWAANNMRAFLGELVKREQSYELDGEARTIHEIVAPIWDGQQVKGIVGVNLDVTEQRRSREALRESEERHSSLLAAIPDMVFLQAADGTYLDFHAPDVSKLVVPPNDFMGKRMQDALPAEMASQLTGPFERVVRSRRTQIAEYTVKSQEGLQFMESRMVPCGEDQVLTIVQNITERKRVQKMLAAQRSVLELIAIDAPLEKIFEELISQIEESYPGTLASIVILDASGEHIADVFGPSMEHSYNAQLIGVSIGPNVGSCGSACYTKELVIVEDIASDPRWEPYRDAALSYGLRACWSHPIVGEQGKVYGSFAMYYAEPKSPGAWEVELIDEASRLASIAIQRIESEARLRALTNELELRVEERTRLLKSSNEELESFSYSVAHDLRAPLRAVAGFSQIVLDDYSARLNAKAKDYLRRSAEAAEKMGHVVDALLELSRINRGDFVRTQVNMSQLAEAICSDLAARVPEPKARFVIHPKLKVQGDQRLLGVVLENLISNALKFSSESADPHIEVGMEAQGDETAYFVRDNGIGFDERFAGRLFQPFESLHGTTPLVGHGIGLATVKRAISKHSGRIWATSQAGNGATFYFTIPD